MLPSFTRGTWPRGLDLSSTIVLDFPLLLDRPTPRLPGIKIVSGGRLVFSPHAKDVSLTTDFVQVAIVIVLHNFTFVTLTSFRLKMVEALRLGAQIVLLKAALRFC